MYEEQDSVINFLIKATQYRGGSVEPLHFLCHKENENVYIFRYKNHTQSLWAQINKQRLENFSVILVIDAESLENWMTAE